MTGWLAVFAAGLFEILLEEKSLRLVLEGDERAQVAGDCLFLRQALVNILHNAVKYSPAGTTITISSRCGAQYVELSVGDQGSGLTADEKRQLGKRCYRSERNSAVSGSGLGLWIASTFVAANGGSLHAESRGPELGATISLRLPTVSEETPELVDTLND